VAGTGVSGYNGDGIMAVSAELSAPSGIAFDASGNLYITDQAGHSVRKVNTGGYISTIVGNGTPGYSGDNGADTNAMMDGPYGICFDNTGNLYITDVENGTVRKVDTAGIITTVAGTGVGGYNGDGIAATIAELKLPEGVIVDNSGNIFIADGANDRIREVNTNGIINTFVGATGQIIIPNLGFETAVNRDACGNLYFVDGGNAVIWRLGISDTLRNIIPQAPSICSGQSISLVVSGGGTTYTWSPATGLSATTGNSVVANPTISTTYTVMSYSSSCVAISQDVITLIPASPLIIQPQITGSMCRTEYYAYCTTIRFRLFVEPVVYIKFIKR
jgi:sugar lactone lactonase YvrE